MRHASLTFDPAAAACDMPASLSIQRPRHATCQRYFRPSGRGMRHAGVTFDPAASACDMPASLSIQRPRGVCGRRRIWPGTCIRPVGGALYPCRPGVCCPGFRPGLWSTGPTARPGTGERPVGAPDHSQGRNPWAAKPWAAKPLVCGRSGRNPWRVDDRGETLGGLTTRRIIPKAGPPGGMLWASSRRPIRGERRPRWGLHAARSAGC